VSIGRDVVLDERTQLAAWLQGA